MLHRRDCDPEKDGGLGEICDVTNMRNLDLTSGQQQIFAPKRIRLSADNNNPQDTIMEFCKESSPLGLKLRKTPSFINLIEMKLSQARKASDQDMKTKMDYEKLKASNFSIALLKIGNWQKKSINEGDLIAKCYFAKKKIVWEVLEGALKSKIEIQWSDIIGIRANLHDGYYGILEIELNNPPLYFQETNPQPRKHTLWQQSTDFTEGQAPMHRRHLVVFPPGVLNKHYEKLLQCDQRLLELSKKPFPTLNNPYFGQKHYGYSDHSFNINGNGFDQFMPLEHAQTFNIPVTIVHPHQSQNFKPIPNPHLGVMDSTPHLVDMDHEIARKWAMGTQRAMLWNQDFNIMAQQSPMEINGNPGLQFQEFSPINSGDHFGIVTPNSGISCPEIGNHLLTDHSQVACSNINSTLQQGGFSWLTPQNSIMMPNNPISNNQALYSYGLAEPTSQDIVDLDLSQNICHDWPHNE